MSHGEEKNQENYAQLCKRISFCAGSGGICLLLFWSVVALPWPLAWLVVSLELIGLGVGLYYLSGLLDE